MKTVLVTGSGHGLGKELASKFAREGYNIILNDMDAGRLKIMDEYLQGFFGNIEMVAGDLRKHETINKLHEKAEEMDIDILINNAGVLTAGKFREMDILEIRAMLDTNLIAPIELTKALYPIFLKKQSGIIVNINSIAGKNPNSEEAVYCASKFGLRGFFDSFKFEAAKHNIYVISVYLGSMNTVMAKDKPDRKKLICPQEAANVIYGLCENHESLRIPEIDIWRKNY